MPGALLSTGTCRGPGAEGSWKVWLSRVVAELRAGRKVVNQGLMQWTGEESFGLRNPEEKENFSSFKGLRGKDGGGAFQRGCGIYHPRHTWRHPFHMYVRRSS